MMKKPMCRHPMKANERAAYGERCENCFAAAQRTPKIREPKPEPDLCLNTEPLPSPTRGPTGRSFKSRRSSVFTARGTSSRSRDRAGSAATA